MARLRDDQIQWILSLDAKGVQSEISSLSSRSKDLARENKLLEADLKAANKQMREAQREMERLTKAGKDNTQAFSDAEATYNSAANDVADYTRRISENTRQISENNRMIDEMVRRMRIQDMTMSQLKKRAKELQRELENTSQATHPEEYAALSRQLDVVRRRMNELGSGSQEATNIFTRFKGALDVFAGNLMAKAVTFIVDKIKEAITAIKEWTLEAITGARTAEGVLRAFNALNNKGLLDKLREQTRGVIGDFELMQSTVKADKYRIPLEEVGNLLEFAGRRAIDMGKDVDDFQRRIIDGIGRQSKVILDDLGFSGAEINKAIAKEGTFAKGVIALVNKELEKQGPRALTAADMATQAAVKWKNAQGEVGDQLLWIDRIWSQLSGAVADAVSKFATKHLPGILDQLIRLYNTFVDLYNSSVILRASIQSIAYAFNTLFNNAKLFFDYGINSAVLLGKSMKAAFTLDPKEAANAFTEYLALNKKSLDEYLAATKQDTKSYLESIMSSRMEYYTKPEISESDKRGPTKSFDYDPNRLQKEKKALDALLEVMETTHLKKMAEIRQQYINGNIKSEAEYERKKFAQEQAYYLLSEESLEKHLKKVSEKEVRDDINKRIAELQDKRLDQQIKFQAELEKIILDADPIEKEKRAYEERLSAVGLFGIEKEKLTSDQLKALELLEKQHQDNLFKIRQDAEALKKKQSEDDFQKNFKARKDEMQTELNELTQLAASASGNAAFDAEMAVHMQRLKMINEEVQARKDAGLEVSKQIEQLGKEETALTKTLAKENAKRTKEYNSYTSTIGTAFGEFLSGQKSAVQAVGAAMIDILYDILAKIIEAKIAEATAVAIAEQAKAAAIAAAQPDSVLTFGASAVARTVAIGAIIMGALQAAKVALKSLLTKRSSGSSSSGSSTTTQRVVAPGYFDGGYTGSGNKYDVKGYLPDGSPYHADEYMIPKEEFRDPVFAPMIRAIENSRRKRTGSNPLPDGYADGGYIGDNTGSDNSGLLYPDMAGLNRSIGELNQLLAYLKAYGVGVNIYEFAKQQNMLTDFQNFAKKG